MRCTKCEAELLPGKKFCHACGARVALTCAQCGATLQPNFRFCPDCGTPASLESGSAVTPTVEPDAVAQRSPQMPEEIAQKIRASKDAIEGERKQVTVLFCDLAGSTALAERLDPEDYHDLLEQYLELAFHEIYRFEGIVNQLAGDGMMALFGAPIAHEDAPQRAVHAALGIRDALVRFNEKLRAERGIELRARFGINTGPVVVGTVGNDLKMDYTAIGDTTNLASRLESLAVPGTVLVSEPTYRLVRGFFEMRAVGPFAVKGKSEPVTAYEVQSRSEVTTPMAIAAERGLTPFVGRGQELVQLEMCYERLAGNLPQVVAVAGEAGIGKSRLLYEFKQRLTGEAVLILEARCSALNQMVPYVPWIAMWRQYFDLASDEPVAAAREKVARILEEKDPQLREFYPFVCRVLGLGMEESLEVPADEMKQRTFEAISRIIEAECNRAPVIMLIEDLHWIDEPSREMLDRAVAELDGRMMVLVSHRPDYQQSWRTSAAFTQLNLRRLSDDDAVQIIRALAGAGLPAELERLILAKAEGSPFFTEEITRALIEEGFLVRDNGSHHLTRPVEEIRIPGTVQEVLAARLDRLGADAKRVLQVAAVMGRQFNRDQLVQLLTGDGVDVNHELEELERRGIIHRKSLFSNHEFRFGESLTQEVAYEGLLLKQRRQLHERIGALLEEGGGEGSPERSALLAHHFVRSENREKAVRALLHAARDAERVPSFRTAARFYREAWALAEPELSKDAQGEVDRLSITAAVGVGRMTVIYNAPDPGDAERIVQRAREVADRLGDTESVVALCTYQGMLMMAQREHFAQGLALTEEGLAVAQRAGLSVPAMSRGLAFGYLLDGRFELAQRTIDWVVSELEQIEDKGQLADIYLGTRYMRARLSFYTDEFDAALQDATTTYELAVRAGNRTVQGGTAATIAHVHYLRADYAEARRWAERSLEMALAVSNMGLIHTEAAISLAAAVELGQTVAVNRYLELMGPDTVSGGELALNSYLVVDALLGLGETKRAERWARLSYQRASGRLREMLCAASLADALRRLGAEHWSEARRCYEQAIALGEALGSRSTLALARLGVAEMAAAGGDRDTCLRQLQQSLTICRDLGLGRYQARAERLLAGLGSGDEVRV